MAFTLAEAVVFFKGDDKQLSGDLDSAESKTKSFASSATQLIGGAVAGAAVAAGAAIIGIGVAAFDVSKDTATAAADMAASLGLPIDEAEKFAEVAKRVYGNNFADDVGDAALAVTEVAKQMKLAAEDPALKTMTENALRLRDSFGIEVADSIGTVKNLMQNFGITSEEAFNLLAAGNQKGLNASGDLLESINEYSVQFSSGGASASEFFSVMESGFQNGMLGTDKAADAFKEFRVRIQDGSTLTSASLTQLGLDAEAITTGLANGTLSAADAFGMVTTALQATENSTTRFQAGVGLLGTQYEDLGDAIGSNLTMTTDWAAASEGAITGLDAKYATFGSAMEGMWRRLIVSVSPFTDKLLELVNDAMPQVMAAFDIFDANIGPMIESVGATVTSVFNFLMPLFTQFGSSIETASGPMKYWKDWVDTNLPLIKTLFENVLGGITAFWDMFGEDILYVVNNTFTVVVTVIDTVMKTIGDIITLALQLLTGDWEGAWETFQGIIERVWETIKTVVATQLDSLKTIFSNIDWGAVGQALIGAFFAGLKLVWFDIPIWFGGVLLDLIKSIINLDWAGAGKSIVDSTKAGAESAWTGFSSWFSTSTASLLDYWNTTTWEQKGKDAIAAVKSGTEFAWTSYRTSLSSLIDGLLSLFTGEDYSGTGEKLINDIQAGIERAWNAFVEYFGQKFASLTSMFTQIDWGAGGKAILDGLKAGLEERWEEFKAWFAIKLSQLTDMLPFSEPKDSNSPLRGLGESGKSFVSNWWEGAEQQFGNIKSNLSGALGGLADGLGAAIGGSQPLGAGNNGIQLTVNVSGENATYENGRAVGRGVTDELRKRGG